MLPFDFNAYSALLLPSFIQGLLFTLLLLWRYGRQRQSGDLFLAGILTVLSLKVGFWMLGYAGWYNRLDAYTTFMFYFPFNNFILIGPLLYFYFLSSSNAHFKLERKYWPHFVLPLLYLGLIVGKLLLDFSLYYPFPIRDDTQGGCRGYFAELDKSDVMEGLAYLTFLYYAGRTLQMLRQYRPYTRQELSFGYEVDFAWLYRLLMAASLVVLVFGIFDLAGLLMAGLSYNTTWYAYFFLGFVIYYLSIQAYSQPNPGQMHLLAFEPAQKTPEPETENLPAISETEKQTLLQWMETHQPFLNPNLTLGMLARQLRTNPAPLSRIINEGFGQNFNDFINQYRVKKVIQDLQQGAHLRHTLLSIALDAGFNSKTTFNRAFKKYASLSPQEYIKKNIKKMQDIKR